MNEQLIKDLWWKARLGYNEQNCDPEVLAKFAVLIVRECADYLDAFNKENYVAEGMDGAYMKEHFGVEE